MRAMVQLDCGCTPYFPSPIPLLGEPINCSVHGECKRVEVTWLFKCEHCRYSRNVGNAPMTAEIKSTAHAIKMHHRVKVWKQLGGKVVEEFQTPPIGAQNVIGLDAPPF
jgi:hypothetical protein